MVTLVAIIIWRLHPVFVVSAFLIFGALDGLYLSSALTKIPDGAWFTLALAVLLSSIFILWRYGKENQWRAEASDRLPIRRLFSGSGHDDRSQSSIDEHKQTTLRLAADQGGAVISPIKGVGIFFDKTGDPANTPTVFIQFLQKFQATPAIAVFFHIRPLSRPTVDPEDRFSVSRCFRGKNTCAPMQNIFRITLRHGYTDEVVTPDLGMVLYEQLRSFIIRDTSTEPISQRQPKAPVSDSSGSSLGISGKAAEQTENIQLHERKRVENLVRQRLEDIKAAYEDQIIYVVGKEQMRIRERQNARDLCRRTALAAFLWLRGNTGSKVANLNIDVDKLVELGFVKVV